MVGKKWNHHHCRVGSMSLLNMALVCIRVGLGTISSHFSLASVGLGNLFWPLICSLPRPSWPLIFWCQNAAKSTVVPPICSREVDLCRYQPSSISHTILIHNKTSCSSVSCRWCGKHYGLTSIKVTSCRLQLIIQEVGLETPYGTLEPACLNGRFIAFDVRFSSLASDRVILRVFDAISLFTCRRLYL